MHYPQATLLQRNFRVKLDGVENFREQIDCLRLCEKFKLGVTDSVVSERIHGELTDAVTSITRSCNLWWLDDGVL